MSTSIFPVFGEGVAPVRGLRVSEQSVLQQGPLSFVLARTQQDGDEVW